MLRETLTFRVPQHLIQPHRKSVSSPGFETSKDGLGLLLEFKGCHPTPLGRSTCSANGNANTAIRISVSSVHSRSRHMAKATGKVGGRSRHTVTQVNKNRFRPRDTGSDTIVVVLLAMDTVLTSFVIPALPRLGTK